MLLYLFIYYDLFLADLIILRLILEDVNGLDL
jgi:hypothetical protein